MKRVALVLCLGIALASRAQESTARVVSWRTERVHTGDTAITNTTTHEVYGASPHYRSYAVMVVDMAGARYVMSGKHHITPGDYAATLVHKKHNDAIRVRFANGKSEEYAIIGMGEIPKTTP